MIRKAFLGAIAIILSAEVASAEVKYIVDQTIPNRSTSGGVTADPEIGVLGAADFTDWTRTRIFGLPEPSAWMLGLVGFAGLGLGAFRKRKPRLPSGLD